VLDKLAAGDRALAAGDLRGALFAYQDAVYAQPDYAFARVKLGRAYLAMRYPALAAGQAQQALALDPGSADARALAEDASKPVLAPAAATPVPASTAAPAPSPARVYPISAVEQPRPAPSSGAAPAAAATASVAPVASAAAPPAPVASAPPAAAPAPAAAPPAPQTAAQHYRTAVGLIGKREFKSAEAELDEALAKDPRLAVAYSARASARFGLGRTRDAADDYRAALELDPALATPLYGLAECYRLLGDPAASDLYLRYAQSRAPDVREELRLVAQKRAKDLAAR
jgi:tetratricopeptide (TPR) repeat protein